MPTCLLAGVVVAVAAVAVVGGVVVVGGVFVVVIVVVAPLCLWLASVVEGSYFVQNLL